MWKNYNIYVIFAPNYKMMKTTIKMYFLLSLCLSVLVFSQTVVKRDTLSGTVLVTEIDTAVNNALTADKEKCNIRKSSGSYTSSGTRAATGSKRVAKTMTRAEICRRHPKMLGYKIMVGVRRNSKEANALKSKFRKSFPRMKAMTDASLRPNYKILAGSFVSRKSGKPYLNKVRRAFPSATLVQYQVYCVEAK